MTEATKPTQEAPNTLPSAGQKRRRMIRRTYLVSILFLIFTIADSASRYQEFGNWQILADAGGIILGLLLLISSAIAFSRKNIQLANFLIPLVILAAYAPGDLFLDGVTAYNLISGLLILVLAYYIFRPQNLLHWLRMGALHILLVLLFSNINLFERFDMTASPSWQATLPIFTSVLSLLILWQIIANLEIRTLQTRLVLILIALGFIPVLIASTASILIGYNRDTQQAENYLKTISLLKSEQINTWVAKVFDDLDIIENNSEWMRSFDFLINFSPTDSYREQLTSELRTGLQDFQNNSENYYQQIFFANNEGTILASTDPVTEGINISTEAGYLFGKDNTYLTPLEIDSTATLPKISIYHPLYNQDGDRTGMIVGRLNTALLSQFMQEDIQIGETGEAYLVDSNNRLLTPLKYYPDSPVGKTTIDSQATDNAFRFLDSQTAQYNNFLGDPVIGTYQWIPELKSVLIIEQSASEAFQALRLNLVISTAIALITLAITISIAVITSRNLSEPIQRLAEEASQVWKGELKHIEPIERADEIGILSSSLSEMTDQMVQTTENLESLVSERTQVLERRARYLETTSQISRAITAIYDIDNLLNTVAHLISENFGFYHIGIFILDENREFAVLRASNSEGGWRMLARQHKLQVGKQGIVGYVSSTGEPRIQQQVAGEGSIHYENPDLPLTRSEMALPLKVGTEIFGALDVQSTEEMAFSEEDVFVLQGLADAVAVAIQNTRLVQQLQENLETERRMYGAITQQAWASLLSRQQTHPAYRSDETGTQLISSPATDVGKQALKAGKTVIGEPNEDTPYFPIAVPVSVRGGVIVGVLETKKPVSAGEWSKEEITILENVCEELGLALENARLLEDTQRKAQKDRIAAELAAKIWASSDVENILQTAVRELGSALQVSRGTIRLSLPEERDQPVEGRERA